GPRPRPTTIRASNCERDINKRSSVEVIGLPSVVLCHASTLYHSPSVCSGDGNYGRSVCLDSSFFSVIQFFASGEMIYWKIAASADSFGPYFNRDHYAGLMVLMLPICGMYAVVRRRSDAARTILWFAVL